MLKELKIVAETIRDTIAQEESDQVRLQETEQWSDYDWSVGYTDGLQDSLYKIERIIDRAKKLKKDEIQSERKL